MREERGGIQRGMRATLARVESSVLHALPGPLRKAADLLLATRRGRLEAKAQAVEDERVRLEKEANPNPNPNPNPTATPTPIPTPNPNPTPTPTYVGGVRTSPRSRRSSWSPSTRTAPTTTAPTGRWRTCPSSTRRGTSSRATPCTCLRRSASTSGRAVGRATGRRRASEACTQLVGVTLRSTGGAAARRTVVCTSGLLVK